MTMTRNDIEELIANCPDGGQVNLHGADLSGIDLSGLKLVDVNLCRATCIGTDFSKARLKGANISEANLKGAKLSGADLEDVNFAATCLCGALLYNSHLRRVNFCDACALGAEGLDIAIRKCSTEQLNTFIRKGCKVTYTNGVAKVFGRAFATCNITDFSDERHYEAADREHLMATRSVHQKAEAERNKATAGSPS